MFTAVVIFLYTTLKLECAIRQLSKKKFAQQDFNQWKEEILWYFIKEVIVLWEKIKVGKLQTRLLYKRTHTLK